MSDLTIHPATKTTIDVALSVGETFELLTTLAFVINDPEIGDVPDSIAELHASLTAAYDKIGQTPVTEGGTAVAS